MRTYRRSISRREEAVGHARLLLRLSLTQRAWCAVNAEVVLKATNVDGVYDCDPKHNAAARMHRHVSYDEVARDRLSVMDATAITLCAENAIPGKMLRSRQRVSHLLFESRPWASFESWKIK
jgi:hypothetical protein